MPWPLLFSFHWQVPRYFCVASGNAHENVNGESQSPIPVLLILIFSRICLPCRILRQSLEEPRICGAGVHYLEFRWHKRIAKGGGGEVFFGDALVPRLSELSGPTIIVVGESRQALSNRMSEALDQKISIMNSKGRHQNIAGLLGWCDKPVAILMKNYPLGSLETLINQQIVAQRRFD